MNLQPSDIIVKNTKDGEALWLSQRLVQEVCGISDAYLRKERVNYKKSVQACYHHLSFLPDSGKGWRWAKTDRGFFYCYDNIPDRVPTHYRSKLGTVESLKAALNEVSAQAKTGFKDSVKAAFVAKAMEFYSNNDVTYFMYDAEVVFNPAKAKELATAKAWCIFMKEMYTSEGFKAFGIQKKQDFLSLCTDILTNAWLEGLRVTSPAYLRQKIERFPDSGTTAQCEFLISDKFDNDNARKIGKTLLVDTDTGEEFKFDAHEALMFYGYMNPGSSSKESIRKIYTDFYYDAIIEWGHEPVKYRTFCHHLAKLHTQILTAKERHGVEYYKKHHLTYIPQQKLQYAHSLFAGDGSGTVNYKYYNAKGELKSMKLYVILIADVASRQIVGWAPSLKGQHTETPEMVEQAVKMAVKNCGFQTMFEFVSDNHGAFTSRESRERLEMVFNKVRTIEAHNSQSNPAETEFRLFKKTLKRLPNWTSSSWSVGVEGQANPDYVDFESLPTYEDAIIQFSELVEKWNHGKLRDLTTPAERFENKHPRCVPMDARIIRKLFGNHTEVDLSYMRGFVNVHKTQGYEKVTQYQFEIPDYWDTGAEILGKATNYRKNIHVKVVWDEEMADLYTLDGKFIISCPPALKASSSHAESDENSEYNLGHNKKRKKNQLAAADEFMKNLMDVFESGEPEPYEVAMALGGSKESYNGLMDENEGQNLSKKELKKKRINRDFDDNW